MATEKTTWQGTIMSVQPRIRLLRTYDQRQHNYPGYVLRIDGSVGGNAGEFMVAIGKSAQTRHQFRCGDKLSGMAEPVADSRVEIAGYYKASKLRLFQRGRETGAPPPWTGEPPDLKSYRTRGHRRLDPRTYETQCINCIWGCMMPVEITVDFRNPDEKIYRTETFCYGPKSCRCYKAGPKRTVPARNGVVWTEEDTVDEAETAHRGMDE